MTGMHDAFFTFRSSEIHYSYCNGGNRVLICLHGYGESAETFHFLQPYLQEQYSMLAIDLPFHGKTVWNEGMNFTARDLADIIKSICIIHFLDQHDIYFMGYSMGARIVLSLLPHFARETKSILLIAPDGFEVNFWYWLSTQTLIGNRFFSFTMKHPQWFFVLLKTGNALGLVNQSIFKFTKYYINDKAVRKQLYDRWTCMRKFKPRLSGVKKLITQCKIRVCLLYGKHDRIIRFERGEKFTQHIEDFCSLEILDCGHQVLHEKNAARICNVLQS